MKFIFSFFLVLILAKGFTQNIGINASGATPHNSAMLDVSSTTKGIPATEKQMYTLSYEQFVVPLVKAVQEQQATIENQSKKISGQETQLKQLTEQVAALAKSMEALSKGKQ